MCIVVTGGVGSGDRGRGGLESGLAVKGAGGGDGGVGEGVCGQVAMPMGRRQSL